VSQHVIAEKTGRGHGSGRKIPTSDDAVQTLTPQDDVHRYEGIAFSPEGDRIALATSEGNAILLYRRGRDGQFEDTPYLRIGGRGARLDYPHDAAFARVGDRELLAVASRGGSVPVWEKHRDDEDYPRDPAFEIGGPEAALNYSDGVAFVPPRNDHIAVCNALDSSITFYRMTARAPVAFRLKPVFTLRHESLQRPDGLAFSACGRWLAAANHGADTATIYRRRSRLLSGNQLRYRAKPVAIIRDSSLRFPHSVAFAPRSNALVVTNAGANYFNLYAKQPGRFRHRWAPAPIVRHIVGDDAVFREVNASNKMEGGPKGVAIHEDCLAICGPEYGVKIYSFAE
jgi:hypothetical protein